MKDNSKQENADLGTAPNGAQSKFALPGSTSSFGLGSTMMQFARNGNKTTEHPQTTLFKNTGYGKTRTEFLKELKDIIEGCPTAATDLSSWLTDNVDAYLGAIFTQVEKQQGTAAKNAGGYLGFGGSAESGKLSEQLLQLMKKYSALRLLMLSDTELQAFAKTLSDTPPTTANIDSHLPAELRHKLEKAYEDINKLRGEAATAEFALKQKQAEIDRQLVLVEKTEADKKNLAADVEKLRETSDKNRGEALTSTSQLQALQTQLSRLEAEKTELSQVKTKQQAELDTLRAEERELRYKNSGLTSQLSATEELKAKFQADLQEAKSANSGITHELKEKTEVSRKLELEVTQLRAEKAAMQQELANLRRRNEDLEKASKEKDGKLFTMLEKNQELVATVSTALDETRALNQSIMNGSFAPDTAPSSHHVGPKPGLFKQPNPAAVKPLSSGLSLARNPAEAPKPQATVDTTTSHNTSTAPAVMGTELTQHFAVLEKLKYISPTRFEALNSVGRFLTANGGAKVFSGTAPQGFAFAINSFKALVEPSPKDTLADVLKNLCAEAKKFEGAAPLKGLQQLHSELETCLRNDTGATENFSSYKLFLAVANLFCSTGFDVKELKTHFSKIGTEIKAAADNTNSGLTKK